MNFIFITCISNSALAESIFNFLQKENIIKLNSQFQKVNAMYSRGIETSISRFDIRFRAIWARFNDFMWHSGP